MKMSTPQNCISFENYITKKIKNQNLRTAESKKNYDALCKSVKDAADGNYYSFFVRRLELSDSEFNIDFLEALDNNNV